MNSSYVDSFLSSLVFLVHHRGSGTHLSAATRTPVPQTGRMLCAIHQPCTFPTRPEAPPVRQSAYVLPADTPPASFQIAGRRSLFPPYVLIPVQSFPFRHDPRPYSRCSTNSSPAFNGYDLSATQSVPPAMSDKTRISRSFTLTETTPPGTGTFPEIAFRPPTWGRTSKVL